MLYVTVIVITAVFILLLIVVLILVLVLQPMNGEPMQVAENIWIGPLYSLKYQNKYRWDSVLSVTNFPKYPMENFVPFGMRSLHLIKKTLHATNVSTPLHFIDNEIQNKLKLLIHDNNGMKDAISLLASFLSRKTNTPFTNVLQKLKSKVKSLQIDPSTIEFWNKIIAS